MSLQRFNSIKIKLMAIYVSVVFIIMAISGTFMLWRVRSMEEMRAHDRLQAFADYANAMIVQPNARAGFITAMEANVLQNPHDIQLVLKNETGVGIAPLAFSGWRQNDRALSWAMSGREGISVGRVSLDLHGNEVEWISFAMPVDHPDGRVIIHTSMSTTYMNENLSQLTGILLWTALISLLIVPVAWFFLAETLTRPIIAMTRWVRSMGAGDLNQKLEVHSKDEIGVLAQGFNHMSEEIRRHLEQQSKLDEMRKEFVANVSHELRTPLTSIRTYTETLIDGALEDADTAHSFLQIIDEEAKRMANLVTDLLELSRLDSKRSASEMDVVDLLGLLRLTVRQCQVLAEKKGQHIELAGETASCFTVANAHRINQVMHNVLSNAIKYSPENTTVHVTIQTDDFHHRITVQDEGIGIPKESVGRIFERFYRVDKARSRAMGGTGLGLAIAKEIMEEHGGSIHAQSTPDHGTTMTLQFKREGVVTDDAPPTVQRVKYV